MPEFKTKHTRYVMQSAARKLYAEAQFQALNDALLPEKTPNVGSLARAIYAVSDKDEVVGLLCYTVLEHVNAVLVVLGYVEPSSRRLGVFRLMVEALRHRLAGEGKDRILFDIAAHNEPALDAVEAVGAEHSSYTYALSVRARRDDAAELLGSTD